MSTGQVIHAIPEIANHPSTNKFSALQCRLECESGYVAQKTALITCVKGEYEKGCHYMVDIAMDGYVSKILSLFSTLMTVCRHYLH